MSEASSRIVEVEDSHWRYVDHFAGRAVKIFSPDPGIVEPVGVAYRIGPAIPHGAPAFAEMLALVRALLTDPQAARVEALVIGAWGGSRQQNSDPIVEALAEGAGQLPGLRAIYLGDITPDENEISWIEQGDPAPLLEAFPELEHLRVRAPGQGRSVGVLRHDRLRSLTFQSGGLPLQAATRALEADLPALEHLELWLGREEYGSRVTAETFVPLLSGKLFPALRYLGLRNSEQADAIATALASSPILERLEVLDLSLGTLSDAGAEALLSAPAIGALQVLDLHHHYLSEETLRNLEALGIPRLEFDRGEANQDEDDGEIHRFTAVGE